MVEKGGKAYLTMEKKGRDPLLTVFAVLSTVLALLLAMTLINASTQTVECKVPTNLNVRQSGNIKDARLDDTKWACNSLVCKRLMTPEEWVGKYCTMQTDGVMGCRIGTPQGPVILPLTALNLSAVVECAQYQCQQEVLVRDSDYTISAFE